MTTRKNKAYQDLAEGNTPQPTVEENSANVTSTPKETTEEKLPAKNTLPTEPSGQPPLQLRDEKPLQDPEKTEDQPAVRAPKTKAARKEDRTATPEELAVVGQNVGGNAPAAIANVIAGGPGTAPHQLASLTAAATGAAGIITATGHEVGRRAAEAAIAEEELRRVANTEAASTAEALRQEQIRKVQEGMNAEKQNQAATEAQAADAAQKSMIANASAHAAAAAGKKAAKDNLLSKTGETIARGGDNGMLDYLDVAIAPKIAKGMWRGWKNITGAA